MQLMLAIVGLLVFGGLLFWGAYRLLRQTRVEPAIDRYELVDGFDKDGRPVVIREDRANPSRGE